jgi:hypothetical protein
VVQFKRVHDSGTETLILQQSNGWQIQINLREPNRNPMTIAGYLTPTVERAKQIADKEVSKYGHVCNGGCHGWLEFLSDSPS